MKAKDKYVHFTFPWWWIRNKIIIHRGNEDYGMLIIADQTGKAVKMYGYELITDNYKNED